MGNQGRRKSADLDFTSTTSLLAVPRETFRTAFGVLEPFSIFGIGRKILKPTTYDRSSLLATYRLMSEAEPFLKETVVTDKIFSPKEFKRFFLGAGYPWLLRPLQLLLGIRFYPFNLIPKFVRSGVYNPFSDTVSISTNLSDVLMHELGHAIDFKKKSPTFRLLYSLIPYLPGGVLVREYMGWSLGRNALVKGAVKLYPKIKDEKARKNLMDFLASTFAKSMARQWYAMGSYLPLSLGYFTPRVLGLLNVLYPVMTGSVIGSGVAGKIVHSKSEKFKIDKIFMDYVNRVLKAANLDEKTKTKIIEDAKQAIAKFAKNPYKDVRVTFLKYLPAETKEKIIRKAVEKELEQVS